MKTVARFPEETPLKPSRPGIPGWTHVAFALGCLLLSTAAGAAGSLRVCADPDNLPFSSQRQPGFENRIASILARDMHATLDYTWMKQRQSFIRQTLGANRCDVIIGVPASLDRLLTTRPYYRSGYVMVTRRGRQLAITSWDDPKLRNLKIGLHTMGNDGANSPPAAALGRHGLARNIVGYSMWGEGTQPNPQGQVIDAVASGTIDMAIVWGPFGGYFASRHHDLSVQPAPTDPAMPAMPFAWDMAMGVRKGEVELAEKLNRSISRHGPEIQKILSDFHIPLFASGQGLPPAPQRGGSPEPSILPR